MMYEFSYGQLFNVFGAPGIPNTYEAVLYRDGQVVKRHTFWWLRKAERQCAIWVTLYGAVPKGDS